jgi:hypothetical protein
MVADRLDIEEHRARDVAGAIFGMCVALLRRQKVGGIDDADSGIAQTRGKPFSRYQPAACRLWGRAVFSSQHDGSR